MSELKMDTDTFAKIFKALGHPTRVRIVEHLIKINSCVCGEIVNIFPFSQSTISQHLKLLKESGDFDVLNKFKKFVSNL